jgi:hypothetical protein
VNYRYGAVNLSMRAATIATLAGFVIVMGFTAQRVAATRAAYAKTKAGYAKTFEQIDELQEALRRYYVDNGADPTSDVGLTALAKYYEMGGAGGVDDSMIIPRPAGPRSPRDAWGHPYFYQSNGKSYVLESFGASGSKIGTRAEPVIITHSPSQPPG